MQDQLISQYVNLYRQLWLSNSGLWTDDLKRMSEKELKKEIKEMKQAIKEHNAYYPAYENWRKEGLKQ